MQTKISYLSDLKFNLETWKRELRFHMNEMDTFQEKLEEIAGREYDKRAMKQIENFQNRILIECNEISKLMHRCKHKMNALNAADYNEHIDGRLMREQHPLKDDMRQYIVMHYELKEEMMDFFAQYLD
jgi:benzoyl-CoA reductase/2-hydroxyglutaryl-CoA dehydratase subunit BcrC/BadD/HgdB